jgi:hypothetical protein
MAAERQPGEILRTSILEDVRERLEAREAARNAARLEALPTGWREISLPGRRLTLDQADRVVQVTPTLPDGPPVVSREEPAAKVEPPPQKQSSTLELAIRARLIPGGRTLPWARFCDEVRGDCNVAKDARGYSDRTIQRIVKEIRAK